LADVSDLDGFDGFSLDEDFLKKSIEEAIPGTDEFNIPGFSDFTSVPARASLSELPAAVSAKKNAKKDIRMEISDEEFEKFLEELSYFPRNLRIAIGEYLTGEAGTDLQKMELVHQVITGHPVKKIARSLEHYLDRSIPIPKDYRRKTAEEYEREKSSLRYIFFNKILPATVLVTIITVLAACTAFLSWQFIYRPVAAENRYKRGYAALQDERYSQSLDLFDEAVRIWEKKKWYFTYARGFKEKKQYISAEMMYERILNRYRNDKAAGLEYAEMLRTDLRNFEKAETILKRRLLDFHVNDPDGLLLLGDTYLDWAEEDFSRYEKALSTYSRLVELYGRKDPYLARLMRYFIRTDNLKEVLPLKEHFTNTKAKIGSEDLIELGGYLLDKRYAPKSGDNEYVRSQIEDVRTFLERAVKADKNSPEAHYNLGRFFIYNYNSNAAAVSLQNALHSFENARTMSPSRALAHVDTFRLLGELHADEKEYLKAQGMYLDGMMLYEDLRANHAVKRSEKVGMLYADYADIDYFITNDLDSALVNYKKSVEELNSTPSVRYRIGYIHYQKQNFASAMETFTVVHAEMPNDRNLLFGYANTLFRRENFFAAQAYYERLQEMLEAERIRKGILFPQIREDHGSFVQDYMRNANNLGVALERLASRTGDSKKYARALALFAESNRAWDALTRNQQTMVRAQGSNLAYLNMQNMTHPLPEFQPEIYADIPRTLENERILQQRTDE
jgi:tetratricopeptide (TPR) repeat protein